MYNIRDYCDLFISAIDGSSPAEIDGTLRELTKNIHVDAIAVTDRVILANEILKHLSREQRIELAKSLIQEQIIDQKNKLSHWSLITAQSAMIDTGYIAQHLVSLQTQIAGQGMRGKGDDLCDGSEVKGANFIDSLDKNGEIAPRWNFNSVSVEIMERFLEYKALYLLSIDLNTEKQYRIRIWKVDVHKHTLLRNRYIEWMQKLGYPKFADPNHKSINFQLFPPRSKTNENFARHGNGRKNGFEKLNIPLENTEGAELIFHADVVNDAPVIRVF